MHSPLTASLSCHLVSRIETIGVKCSTFEYEVVLQFFKFLTHRTQTLWATNVAYQLQLVLCGVQVVHEGKDEGVFFPTLVIWTAAILKMFGKTGGIGRLGIASRLVSKKPFGRKL